MDKYKQLTVDLCKAKELATHCDLSDDGGTCNFDSAMLRLPRWQKEKVEGAVRDAGLRAFFHDRSKCWVISVPVPAQGYARTKQAELMSEQLRADGYAAYVYYQMD